MESLLPFLAVRGPDGQQFTVELAQDRITIGYGAAFNDVALDPDPQRLISRKVHCALERDALGWWVLDNGSRNGTFLRRGAEMEQVRGRALLSEEDAICILGYLPEAAAPRYWELTFRDPLGTKPAGQAPRVAFLEYDWIQARLFRVEGASRQEIRELRPQEHKLIRYMDQRNRANDEVPVMCTYEELLEAVWGEEPLHTGGEINKLIFELRQKVEPDPKVPQFLETVKGLGYRLVTRPLSR